MERKLRAAGYIRVSTALQVEEGESLDTQEAQVRDFILNQKKWTLTNIYKDAGATGTKVEYRMEFQEMISDAKEGKFDAIVFTKLSRFARNARDYQNYAHDLKNYGIQLFSIKEKIDPTDPIGRIIAGMLALFSEWEHETIREQMYENKMKKWREHRTFVGITPFGYEWDNTTNKLRINNTEADIYLRIVNMYIKQGMAMRDIAVKLNADRVSCTRINKNGAIRRRANWYSGTVSYILKNPAYYGNYTVNKVVYESDHRGAGRKRTKKLKPESEMISFPIDGIITKPVWDEIQKTIDFRKIVTKRSGALTSMFFLRNVLKCGRCGSKMNLHIGSKRKDGSVNRYYCCYYASTSKKNFEQRRENKCTLPYIRAEKIEAAVWVDIGVMFTLNPQKAFKDIFDPQKHEQKINELIQTIKNLESDLARKERTIRRLLVLDKLDEDKFNAEDIIKQLRENKEQKLTIAGLISQANDSLKEKQRIKNDEKEALDFLKKNRKQFAVIRKEIKNLSLEDRRLLVEAMLTGPIIVDYQDLNPNYPEDGEGIDATFNLRFNSDILRRFIDEGKFKVLKLNTSLDPAADDS